MCSALILVKAKYGFAEEFVDGIYDLCMWFCEILLQVEHAPDSHGVRERDCVAIEIICAAEIAGECGLGCLESRLRVAAGEHNDPLCAGLKRMKMLFNLSRCLSPRQGPSQHLNSGLPSMTC